MKGWNLRLRKAIDTPFIGKFNAKLNFDSIIEPIQMYLADEEVKDDINDDDQIKDADYYKRRKNLRRKKYNKKSKLVIEDNSDFKSQRGLGKYEGFLCDLSSEDGLIRNPSSSTNNEEDNDNSLFRYALLEVVATTSSNSSSPSNAVTTEVNVIPINNMFLFRRPAIVGDKLLDEIDDDYDEKLRNDKLKLQRYKNIGKILDEVESRNSNDQRNENINDTNGGSTDFAVSDLFGSLAKKSKGGKGAIRKFKGLTGDGGLVDEDVAKTFDSEFQGDYSAKFVDDEEDNIIVEQNYLNSVEEQFTADHETVDIYGEVNAEESDDEDDEDEGKASANTSMDAPSTAIAGIDEDELKRSARVAREHLLGQQKDQSLLKKRSLEDINDQSNAESKEEVEPNRKKDKLQLPVSASSGPTASPITIEKEYDLSAEGVRAYITATGGSVTATALREVTDKHLIFVF